MHGNEFQALGAESVHDATCSDIGQNLHYECFPY